MKRWALIVAGLYFLILVALTLPVVMVAFVPDAKWSEAARTFGYWPYWLWIAVMVLSQAALLLVPAGGAGERPTARRSLLIPVLVGGLMVGMLVSGAIYCAWEFTFRDKGPGTWIWWAAAAAGMLIWGVWTFAFYGASRDSLSENVITRQCRLLLKGSILELLIAVPTHIVARYRNYCCAGVMTFIGLTLGIAVMLFSFGPAVFFLYAARWRRLQPSSEP
jgi:hypothetical protein